MSGEDEDQSWFWSSLWQLMEHEADLDIVEGRVEVFSSIEELFESLHL